MEIEEIQTPIRCEQQIEQQGQIALQQNKKNEGIVAKIKRKKRVKVLWLPQIQKQLNFLDTDPVYIYLLHKLYMSYEDQDYNKNRYFGYADAGVGMIEQLQLDKVYQTVDLKYQIFSQGIGNFRKLIKLYKQKQDIMYYNLATVLEEYQKYTSEHIKYVLNLFSDKEKYSQTLQQALNSVLPEFEQKVKEWACETFSNELYEIELCIVNFDLAISALKKKIFSKNLMMFIGGDLYEIYQKLLENNLKESFSNFLNGGEYNGKLQIEKTINLIKWMMKNRKDELVVEDEVFTLDGLSIPTQKTYKYYYYDHRKKEIVPNVQFHFILVTHYNFEPHWIRYLIETRQQFQQIPKQIEYHSVTNNSPVQFSKNFEFICKQEYFLEKFNYINSHKNNN